MRQVVVHDVIANLAREYLLEGVKHRKVWWEERHYEFLHMRSEQGNEVEADLHRFFELLGIASVKVNQLQLDHLAHSVAYCLGSFDAQR